MAEAKIMSFDTLCPEINVGVKARKGFLAGKEKCDNSDQHTVTPSDSQKESPNKIEGVYFDDLDPATFNPILDPEPGSCFNCWEQGHSRKECPKSKLHDFCYNCGRRDVRVTTCPRCSRAYVDYWKKSRDGGGGQTCEVYDETDKSFESEQNKKEGIEPKYVLHPISSDKDERFSSTESGYCEDMVVDEDKRSLKFSGKFIEDFLNLMNAMKHLPIDTQNTVILQFVEDRRELMKEEGMMTIKIPSIRRIWDSLLALGNYFYRSGRVFLSKYM